MEIVGWHVTHADKSTCIFNAKLKSKVEVEEYAARRQGIIEPVVLLSEANAAILEASGQLEGCKPCS